MFPICLAGGGLAVGGGPSYGMVGSCVFVLGFGAEQTSGRLNGADLVQPGQPPTPSGHEWAPGLGDDRQAGKCLGVWQLGVEGRGGRHEARPTPDWLQELHSKSAQYVVEQVRCCVPVCFPSLARRGEKEAIKMKDRWQGEQ